jgi:hypothetical protein
MGRLSAFSLRKAWRWITGPLSLRREGGKLRVAIADEAPAPDASGRKAGAASAKADAKLPAKATGKAAASAPAAMTEEQRMHKALAAVLDGHARSRKVFRHLAIVETTLRKKGPEGLKPLPPQVLDAALRQLESLVDDWSSPGLTALRRLLSVEASVTTQPNVAAPPSDVHPSDFNSHSRLQVSDASVSEFFRAAGAGSSRL